MYNQTEGNKEVVKRVEEVAKKKGHSMAQIACAWVLAKDPVAAPIIGTTNLKNLQELVGKLMSFDVQWKACTYQSIVEAVHIKLTTDEIKYLEEPYQPMAIFGHL